MFSLTVNGKTYKYSVEQPEAAEGLGHAKKAGSQRLLVDTDMHPPNMRHKAVLKIHAAPH